MTIKQKRLALIAGAVAMLASALLLVLSALRDEIVFFYTPSDVLAEGKAKPGQRFRIGGLVAEGSLKRDGERVEFLVTDAAREVKVRFTGILPDLFREGQGVVAEGRLEPDNSFSATTVLAKHDENYMPREVADALKKQGVWQGENK
jgi:cytochrome c-type biogenesis protein CcmE